jgi:hypothetical protein
MTTVFAIFAMIIGVLASLCMIALLFAGMPNGSPELLTRIKRLMLSVALIGAIGLISAIVALIKDRTGLSMSLGIVPAAYCAILFIVLMIVED